jgi:hypothetical protein
MQSDNRNEPSGDARLVMRIRYRYPTTSNTLVSYPYTTPNKIDSSRPPHLSPARALAGCLVARRVTVDLACRRALLDNLIDNLADA